MIGCVCAPNRVMCEISLHKSPRVQKMSGALSDSIVFGAFAAFAARQSGATLKPLAQAWQSETGQELSLITFSRALRRLGWTRKKRAFSTKSATPSDAGSSSNT